MKLARCFTAVMAWIGDLSSLVYVVVVAVIFYDVVARYLFAAPTFWALELSIMLVASQFMLGGLPASTRNTHVRIDGVYLLASAKTRRWMDIFTGVVSVYFLGFAALYCWKTAISAIAIWETTASIWNSPSPTIVKTVIALAFTLVALQYVVNLIFWIRNEPLPDTAAGPTTGAGRGH